MAYFLCPIYSQSKLNFLMALEDKKNRPEDIWILAIFCYNDIKRNIVFHILGNELRAWESSL